MVIGMKQILRLSLFNIRKHLKESVLLAVLVMLCTLLLGAAAVAGGNIAHIFPEIAQRTQSWNSIITFTEENLNGKEEQLLQLFRADERVTRCDSFRYLFSFASRTLDSNGKEVLYVATFITEENERKIEKYEPFSALSKEAVTAMAHPVWVPQSEQIKRGLKEGDELPVIYGSKKFTFRIAGFYESCCWDSPKLVISDADYAVLKPLFTRNAAIGYHTKENTRSMQFAAAQDCTAQLSAMDGLDHSDYYIDSYEDVEESFSTEINYILVLMYVMAAVIIIAVTVMIWFRIVSDIREQTVNIGVLEALGYKSHQIALSYVSEYLLTAFAGCVPGVLAAFWLIPQLIGIVEKMKGCTASHAVALLPLLASAGAVLLLVFVTAYCKALAVRKYPPVVAFRRGIADHSFRRSHFPLEKTKKNVHLRLAMKGFADHARQNIGLIFVMTVTTVTVVLSLILYSFLGKDLNVMFSIAGQELSDMKITVMQTTDTVAFAEELLAMPEIRKVIPTNMMGNQYVDAVGKNTKFMANIFADYTQTENIRPYKGRFPEHENEIMLAAAAASETGADIGDTVQLGYGHLRQDYIVTGLITAILNNATVYLTEDGFRLLDPLYRPDTFEVYKAEGVSDKELRDAIDRKYGKSAEQIGGNAAADSGSCEERIRAAADQKIAALMEQYGVTNLEYAIQSGDQVITGSSDALKVRSFMNLPEMARETLSSLCTAVSVSTRVFMGIAGVVVMIILMILMESEIRKQRRELGVMKALGYTAKELMLQLSFRIMPAAFLAVVLGTAVSIVLTGMLDALLGEVAVNLAAILLLDAVILVFCFACAYVGARKIKKISVYELMTE